MIALALLLSAWLGANVPTVLWQLVVFKGEERIEVGMPKSDRGDCLLEAAAYRTWPSVRWADCEPVRPSI